MFKLIFMIFMYHRCNKGCCCCCCWQRSTYQATMFGQTLNIVSNGLYDIRDIHGQIHKCLPHASKCVDWFDKMCWYARTVNVFGPLTNVLTMFALVYTSSLICLELLNVESFQGVFCVHSLRYMNLLSK